MFRLALIVILAAGCGHKRGAESETRRSAVLAETTAPARAGDPMDVPFHLLAVELIDPGAVPRQTLRYRPATAVTRATATATIRGETRSESTAPAAVTATVETGLVLAPRSDGRVDVSGLPGSAGGELERYRRLVANASGVAEIDDRGRLVSMSGPSSIDSRRELAAILIRHLVPLPDEPVGDGARWRVVYAIGRGGIFVARRAELALSVDGDEMSVDVAVRESAEPQPIMEGGRGVGDLVALASRATGRFALDLDSPVTSAGVMTVHTTFHARAGQRELLRESTTELALSGDR
jgi:hypothetical protein